MRVATLQSAQAALAGIHARQIEQDRLQTQMSTGLRVNSPGDDPVAAAQAELARSRLTRVAQDQRSAQLSSTLLTSADDALASGVDVLQTIRDTLVGAGNGSYSPAERAILAEQLQASRDRLLAVANSRDSAGGYVFAGQGSTGTPLSGNMTPQYDPAAGEQRIGADGHYATNLDGRSAFIALPQGNGVFLPSSMAGNTGTGVIDAGQVKDATLLTGHSYQIAITGAPGSLQYSVTDTTAGTTLSSGVPFAEGGVIDIDGQRVKITGTPQTGDSFQLQPAGQQSIFKTIDDAIALLKTPGISGASYAERLQGIQTTVDGALDRMSFLRSKVGEEMATTDKGMQTNDLKQLQLETRRSDLQDLDFARAVSEMQVNQTVLQAALKSYASFARLSLFDSLG